MGLLWNMHNIFRVFNKLNTIESTQLRCNIKYKPVNVIKDTVFSSFRLFYWTQKEKYVVKWCNFIIRCYIQTEFEIWTIVTSLYTWKTSIFSLLLSSVKMGWKCQDFFVVQGKNYWSDWKWQLYLVAFYKVTQFCREPFWVALNKRKPEKTESYLSQTTYTHNAIVGNGGGRVVELFACGARGPGFDSPPRHLNFRDWFSPPSPECYTTFWMMTIYSDTLHWSGITPIFDPITDLDLITEFDFLPNCEWFPWNICNGCGMPTEDAYSSGHLVLSFSGLAFVLLVETSDALYRWDIILVCDNITVLDILLNLKFHQILVSIEHLQRVWHADRGRLLLRTPGPVPLWDLQMF